MHDEDIYFLPLPFFLGVRLSLLVRRTPAFMGPTQTLLGISSAWM